MTEIQDMDEIHLPKKEKEKKSFKDCYIILLNILHE